MWRVEFNYNLALWVQKLDNLPKLQLRFDDNLNFENLGSDNFLGMQLQNAATSKSCNFKFSTSKMGFRLCAKFHFAGAQLSVDPITTSPLGGRKFDLVKSWKSTAEDLVRHRPYLYSNLDLMRAN